MRINLRKYVVFRLLCCFVIFAVLPASATDNEIEEDFIKAIYSFKFGRFAEWPTSKLNANETRFGFCVFGKNPFGRSALDAIEGKPVKGKILHVDLFEQGLLSDDALTSCHILFVSPSEKLRLKNILSLIRDHPILTVSDIEGFSREGGMITLIKAGDRIHFEINPDAINRAGLSISSKLLELAKLIKDTESKVTQ